MIEGGLIQAEILAVGSEMLTPEKVDTNSLYLTDQLNRLGVEVVQKSIVGDDRTRLTAAIAGALERSQLVIVTGGLGPTEDDLTRDAAASAAGRTLVFREDLCRRIEERFERMKRRMAEINRRQAFLIDGADALPNERGTAPGQWLAHNGRCLVLLPGPPRELQAMFEAQCLPRLIEVLPPAFIRTRFFRVCGMGESDLDQLIAPVYSRYTNPSCTILAAPGDIQIHLRARCTSGEEAESLLAEVSDQILPLLGDRVYSLSGQLLEEVLSESLIQRNETVCAAESCTGGLLAKRLTAIPGCSKCFAGGFVTYAEELKTKLLGVSPELLRNEGAVSEPVARAMAQGVRRKIGSTWGLSITGFAGPEGGSEANPVGTVYIGLAYQGGCDVKRFHLPGDRTMIRTLAAQFALDLLRRKVLQSATTP